jgi:hypothetical protein
MVRFWLLLGIVFAGLLLVSGCGAPERRLAPSVTSQPIATTEPATAEPTATSPRTVAVAATLSAPRTLAPLPTAAPSATLASAEQLVFVRLGNILRGGAWGEEPQLAASGSELEAWDFRGGLLANAQMQRVQVFDLNKGAASSFDVSLSQEVIYAQVLWGETGTSLLYAAAIEDAQAARLGRSVLLLALDPHNGSELGRATLRDVAGVILLRYDEALQQAALIPFGEDERLTAVERYDLRSGQRTAPVPIAGQGEAVLSPDGRWLLTQQLDATASAQQLLLTDLEEESLPRGLWKHPAGSHAVSLSWSPDGRHVAFLLRDGLLYYEATEGRGLWVLDVATREAHQVLELSALNSRLVGWSPDGASLLGYQRGFTGQGHYFAVRPDGGDYRILGLDAEAQVLGWMPRLTTAAPLIAIDPWLGRVVATRGDAEALAQVVAEYVVAYRDQDLATTKKALEGLLREAGWETGLGQPGLLQVQEGLWLAQLPPMSIYALKSGGAQALAHGDLVLDARLVGGEMGLVYGVIGASAVQPAYSLFRRDGEGRWQLLWTPQGQRDWIATDGEIGFVGQGLGTLEVRGTSFGLENEVFHECHACPHRRLMGRWVRQDDAYVRQTELRPAATLEAIYWEMTERTPYAVLYEFLRRLRLNLPVDDLIVDTHIVAKARLAGITVEGTRWLAEEDTTGQVNFGPVDGKARFIAQVRDGKLVAIRVAP